MGFRTGSYAKVWETRPGKGNYSEARISVSKKDKSTGEYNTEFSGWVRLIGNAHQKINTIKNGDSIRLGDVDVTNRYVKEKNTTYVNYAVFDFDTSNSNGNGGGNKTTKRNDNFQNISAEVDEELPFA